MFSHVSVTSAPSWWVILYHPPLWGLQATPGCSTPWHVQLPHEFNKYACVWLCIREHILCCTNMWCMYLTCLLCILSIQRKWQPWYTVYEGSVEWCEVGGGATYVIWQCLQLFNTHIPLVKTYCSLGPPNTFHVHTPTRQLQHCRQTLLSPVGVQLKPLQALGHGLLHTTQVPVVAKQWT